MMVSQYPILTTLLESSNSLAPYLPLLAAVLDNTTTPIYRGVSRETNNPAIVDRKTPRPAANAGTAYLDVSDHFLRNMNYPQRRLSHICSTSEYIAQGYAYGSNCIIVPLPGTMVAVADTGDYWDLIRMKVGPHAMKTTDELNDIMVTIRDELIMATAHSANAHFQAEDLIRTLPTSALQAEGIDVDALLSAIKNILKHDGGYDNDVVRLTQELRAVLSAFGKKLSSKVTVVNYNVGTRLPQNVEVWMEGPCLYVPTEGYGSVDAVQIATIKQVTL